MALASKIRGNIYSLLIASKTYICSIDQQGNSCSTLEIPVKPKPEGANKPVKEQNEDQGDSSHMPSTTCLAVSPCGSFLAAATVEKMLLVWNESNEVIFNQEIPRKASAVTFTPDSKEILVADKSGDVYHFFLDAPGPGRLILGHLSVLLDLLVSPDGRFVITCDRDEKIRVSHFPNAYNIQGFCLGHTEYVTSLALVQDSELKSETWLVSASGDGTIALWDYGKCVKHCQIKCSQDEPQGDDSCEATPLRAVRTYKDIVAAILDRLPQILIYQVVNKSLVPVCTIQTQRPPLLVTFDAKGVLWTVEDNEAILHCYDGKTGSQDPFTLPEDALPVAKGCASSCPKDLSPLHKRWFDNMQAYKAAKEERLAKKQKISD